MGTLQKSGDNTPTPPDKSTVILLLLTMGDTTWRMFVPIIGMLVIGLLADKVLHTKPWIMIACLLLGITLAALLVINQFKKVKRS